MAAREMTEMRLICPACKAEGKAEMSENDGWEYLRGNVDRFVHEVTPGFSAERGGKPEAWTFKHIPCDAVIGSISLGHGPFTLPE